MEYKYLITQSTGYIASVKLNNIYNVKTVKLNKMLDVFCDKHKEFEHTGDSKYYKLSYIEQHNLQVLLEECGRFIYYCKKSNLQTLKYRAYKFLSEFESISTKAVKEGYIHLPYFDGLSAPAGSFVEGCRYITSPVRRLCLYYDELMEARGKK